MAKEKKVGEVTHYFGKIGVAIVKLSSQLKIGDKLHIKGHTTDFEDEVTSMQINHQPVEKAAPKEEVGLKVKEATREGDVVFKIEE
jgi:putative protease